MSQAARVLAPGAECVVCFHLVTDGSAIVRTEGEPDLSVVAGDIVISPHGNAYSVSNGTPSRMIDAGASLGSYLVGELKKMEIGGGGDTTRFACSYFGCERHAAHLFLAGLPTPIKMNVRNDEAGRWFESSIHHLLAEASAPRPG